MNNIDIHMYWKGKRRDLRVVIYFAICALLIYWFREDIGTKTMVFLLILTYPILAWIDHDKDKHNGEAYPTLKKWFSKFKK